MKLHEVLRNTTSNVTIVMRKAGKTMVTMSGYSTEVYKYGYIPNVDIIDISASDDTLIIECDIDSIKGA